MKRLLAVALAGLLLLAALAGASSARRHSNRITSSALGPLKLGMTKAAAMKALKQVRPGTLRSADDTKLGGGRIFRAYSYYHAYGNDTYSVGFLGRHGHPDSFRVARIVTMVHADRTARGAHVGMGLRPIYKAYGRVMRCDQTIYNGTATAYTPCRLSTATKPHIVLLFSISGNNDPWHIARIVVQQPGLKIPITQ